MIEICHIYLQKVHNETHYSVQLIYIYQKMSPSRGFEHPWEVFWWRSSIPQEPSFWIWSHVSSCSHPTVMNHFPVQLLSLNLFLMHVWSQFSPILPPLLFFGLSCLWGGGLPDHCCSAASLIFGVVCLMHFLTCNGFTL